MLVSALLQGIVGCPLAGSGSTVVGFQLPLTHCGDNTYNQEHARAFKKKKTEATVATLLSISFHPNIECYSIPLLPS
jgi:hypothetical protein